MTQLHKESASQTPKAHSSLPIDSLRQQWLRLREQQPGLRIRNAANMLGVSEAELLATDCGGDVKRLALDPADLLAELNTCGPLMALVRNPCAVHETTGTFGDMKGQSSVRMFLGQQDQRLFVKRWTRAFAVQVGARESVQFFNAQGRACFKVFTTPETRMETWQALIARFIADDQSTQETGIEAETPDNQVALLNREQVQALRTRWSQIQDVHQFQGLLKHFRIRRLTAIEEAGPEWTQALAADAMEQVLEQARDRQLSLMTFVGNGDAVQIHTSAPKKLMRTGAWFNILDPDFSLHLNTEAIAQVWRVRRPVKDGVVTSVEAFDHRGELIVQCFGERHEGEPENPSWTRLAEELPAL